MVFLAVVQYRWSEQVSAATSLRLADSLQMSMTNWHLNVFRDLSDICLRLRADGATVASEDLEQQVRRFHDWQASAPYPDVVSRLHIIPVEELAPRALTLSRTGPRFEPGPWPSRFDGLEADLQRAGLADGPAGGDLDGWRFEPSVPALLRPMTIRRTLFAGAPADGGDDITAWLVVELDADVIRTRLLPDLAKRYFSGVDGLDYQVALVAGGEPRRVLYSSEADFAAQDPVDADGRLNLFGRPLGGVAGHSSLYVFHAASGAAPPVPFGATWVPLLRQTPPADDWQLVVRHRRGGSLGAFAANVHRRDLAISFGLLLLLVISMAMWIIAGNRAQRLARVQMDFVTAVSHELRTPLTIIRSAADNIALGDVQEQAQVAQYGAVIGGQARRLSDLVEQVLLFASIREAPHLYVLRPVDVSEAIDTTLAALGELIQASHVIVERNVAPDLPPVMADALGLAHCLQNLVTNALKYGGSARWLGLRAGLVGSGDTRQVEITVTDRGPGIAASDLPHIFKPFYRSPLVVDARIHGTGLGLALARRIVEAMKGELSVASLPGQGTCFTLRIPCAGPAAS